jgi:hypothetical protein
MNFVPRGNAHPFIRLNGVHSLLLRRKEGQTEGFHPLGDKVHPWDTKFTPGGPSSPLGTKLTPGGPSSTLGAIFTPRGEIKKWPLASVPSSSSTWHRASPDVQSEQVSLLTVMQLDSNRQTELD